MKKIFVTGIIFLFGSVMAFAQSNNDNGGWKSHTQCESNEHPVANPNGAFSSSWTTTSSSSTQKEGTQNHYNGGVNGGGNVGAAKVGGNLGMSRDGEKTTNNSGNSSSTTNTVRYNCEENK